LGLSVLISASWYKIYRHRNLIERCWSCLKERRAIATRYDETVLSYAVGIAIAATLDWIKSLP
jgi:hypothetical protein